MGYFIFFGLVYIGYCLTDWGHYLMKHDDVSMWFLVSGQGTKRPEVGGIAGKLVKGKL